MTTKDKNKCGDVGRYGCENVAGSAYTTTVIPRMKLLVVLGPTMITKGGIKAEHAYTTLSKNTPFWYKWYPKQVWEKKYSEVKG